MTVQYFVTGYTALASPGIGINDQGEVVGTNFLYENGAYTTLADPSVSSGGTDATGINDQGQIVGGVSIAAGGAGFLYANGAYSNLQDPSATYEPLPGLFINATTFTAINNNGVILGQYVDRGGIVVGFTYRDGVYTPRGGSGSFGYDLVGINDSGQVIGNNPNNGNGNTGFIYSNGVSTTISDPLAGSVPGGGASGIDANTYVTGVNDKGQVIGYYTTDYDTVDNVFIYDNGVYTNVNVPAADIVSGVTPTGGINDSGQFILYGGIATLTADDPTISGAVAGQTITDEQTDQPFSTVVIADTINPTQVQTVSVTLSSAANGFLSNLDGGTYNAATGVYTISGTVASVTAALDGLTFTPTAHQVAPGSSVTTAFTISDDDGLATAADSTTTVIATALYNPPTITGAVAGQTLSGSDSDMPFSTVAISDPDNPPPDLTLTVTLSDPGFGTLSNLGGGYYDPATGVYTISCIAPALTAALDALTFNATEILGSETTTFTIGVTDGSNPTVFNSSTSVVATATGPGGSGPNIAVTGTGGLVTTSGGTTTAEIVGTVSDDNAPVSSVTIYDGTTALGAATVNADGSWSFDATLSPGSYSNIRAVATDADNSSNSAEAPFDLIVGLSGFPYTAEEKLFNSSGDLVGRTYFNPDGTVYLAGTVQNVSFDELGYVYATGSALGGQSYDSYESFFTGDEDNAVYLGLDTTSTGPGAGSYSSYTYQYSAGNDFLGSKFYYTNVSSQPYTSVEYDYAGGGALTRADYAGVTGTGYSSYEYDFVGGVYSGAKYEVPAVQAGASYSSYELDYNYASVFAGYKFYFTNLPGQSYTGEEEDFNASAQLSRVLLTGVENQAYSSLELDYSAGAYEGYKAYYTDIAGQIYTGQEVDVTSAGQITKVVDTGMASTPYSSVEEDFSDGALTGVVYGFTDVTGASYYAYQVSENASNVALQETLDNNDGSHTIIGFGGVDQTFTSIGDDTITGGAGFETFVFHAIYGADTITDFYKYTASDKISLPSSEFADFQAVQAAAATNAGNNVVITAADGDTLTLAGMNTTTLAGLSADFTFHS
jgi:probable HAF family extracellular repeat protein